MMKGKNQVNYDDEKEAMREELEELRSLNQVLTVQQLQDRGALNEAKKDLVSGWKDSTDWRSVIGVKLFGALDSKPFLVASYRKYSSSEVAQEKSAQICSLWEKELSNPAWHPFDVIEILGEHQEVIHDDEKLLKLKKDWGDDAYNAVRTALTELNQYNPSGKYIVPELWNYVEGKKVTLAEAIKVLLKLSKSILTQ
ncbi:hypothetical protein GIB67_040503 [Kingdonia uniflora]|uniref:Factor of DNA methylation 1-5/IDN2 domain-containing protein n=1 Tax=Kingdonia uniflora TaxID=39325 RepID=A0A7J7L592_9MAGN|nr:hypothetical protein GIB67_040503 [Kingdonia uniflora]